MWDEQTMEQKSTNPYGTDKLAHHPAVIERLRRGDNKTLILVHLMPQNVCNQRCNFCSYRMTGNKNARVFDERASLDIRVLEPLFKDFKEIGVKAVEVTGGGEPLAYRHRYRMFELLFECGFDVGLVTNGTLLDKKLSDLVAPNLTWARISIDAATPSTYSQIRKTPISHFYRALQAIENLRESGTHADAFRLGAGFVLSNGNEAEVYDFCLLMKRLGVDNVRLSMTFAQEGLAFFDDPRKVALAMKQAESAENELSDANFQVFNQMPRRFREVSQSENNYRYCFSKDIICVVEGAGNVYTCCTFTGSEKGLLGNVLRHPDGFAGIWQESQMFRLKLKPASYCKVPCLYRDKNLRMLEIVREVAQTVEPLPPITHVNFV